jgi:hypothetical protein
VSLRGAEPGQRHSIRRRVKDHLDFLPD